MLRKRTLFGHVGDEVPNPARWKQPPHVAFANLLIDPKSVRAFNSTYGPVITDPNEIPEAGDSFEVHLTLLGYMQDRLRDVWRDRRDLKLLWFGRGGEGSEDEDPGYYLPVRFTARAGELHISDCWTYLRLLLARDLLSGRARICENDTCPTPYFVARREDAIYCCHKCATDVATWRYRRKKAKGSRKVSRKVAKRKGRKHGRFQAR
jgi:hypothetical protein